MRRGKTRTLGIMTERQATLIFGAVLLLFVGGGLLALYTNTPLRFVGGLLAVAGVVGITFAKAIANAQKELAKKPYVPAHWGDARPMLYYLWGTGVLVMGVLLLLGWS
jgi:hypothetical protein